MTGRNVNKIQIEVRENWPIDVGLKNVAGVRTLILRPGQTFNNARDNIRNVLPGITVEEAERMLREQCPEFKDIDELLGLSEPAPPSVERTSAEPVKEELRESAAARRRRRAVVVAAMVPALVASWALGRYTDVVDSPHAQAKASAPDEEVPAGVPKAPFHDPRFGYWAGANNIECDPTSTLEAECTDADGMVMSTKAATGPDSTIFTFSYGSDRVGLRVFYDADYADTWARQDASKELYPNMRRHGRYVLWGTDPKRIGEYMGLLQDADREGKNTMSGGIAPLPPRLAALTLGTLGLTHHQVNQIIAQPAQALTDTPVVVAARLVLGLDTAPARPGRNDDDIVAIAAGIDQTPPVSGSVRSAVTTAPSGAATAPAVSEPQPAATPSEPAKPPVQSTPSAPSTPPAQTPAPPVQTTPAPPAEPTSPPATPTAPPATPSQPETPTPPVTETPVPPVEETPAPPVAPETPAPPVEETPAPPVEEVPAAPAEETPAAPASEAPAAPVETPAAEAPVTVVDTVDQDGDQGQDEQGGDLVILDSAWTVATAA